MTLIVDATDDHVRQIIPRLRPADVEETLKFGKTLENALAYTMAKSPYRKAWIVDGQVGCIFGVGITRLGKALPWLWATSLVEKHVKEFTRAYLGIMPEVMAAFPVVETVIAERYRPYMAWLAKHGVTVESPKWNETAQENMCRVELRAAHVSC